MANELNTATQKQSNITPQQRNNNFAQLTRQHIQALPAKTATEGATISFEIPRARLLSNIKLLIKGAVQLIHASDQPVFVANAPFPLVKKIEVNLNNGFSPYVVSGVDAYFLNLLRDNSIMEVPLTGTVAALAASRAMNKIGGVATASSGTANQFQMIIDLPLTLNDRDPAGLIMLQAPDVLVNVNVTLGTFLTDLITTTTGFTATVSAMTIQPIIETFSIPASADALPDLSIIKLVNSRTETIAASGTKVISLPAGNMYRKLMVWVKDSSGVGVTDASLTTDFKLNFNTADQPYKIPHKVLSEINQMAYGKILPDGLFVFDFTLNGGTPNFGSARDYVDTSQLTQFDLEFDAAAAGTVTYCYETLSILKK